MKIFEFIFNPKQKEDLIFDSFCYKPENIYEKNKGHLCMVGLLRNALPTNLYLIKKIARTIKDQYFRSTDSNLQTAFKRGLKEVNNFLSKKADRGDTSWLGDLSFLALSLKKYSLIFSKTGDIKVLVVRDNNVVDIDKKTQYNETSPYPIKPFARAISSKLAKKDLILIFTRQVYDFFKKEGLLEKIIEPSYFNEKKIKKILNKRKKKVAKVKGVFLGISLKELKEGSSQKTTLKKLKSVPFKEIFTSFLDSLKKFEFPKINFHFPKKKKRNLKLKAFDRDLSFFSRKIKPLFSKKKILIIAPIIILALGTAFFFFQKDKRIKDYQTELIEIERKISEANELYNSKELKKANELFQESWVQLTDLKTKSEGFSEELTNSITTSKEKIEPELFDLNNVKEIKEPNLFFNFAEMDFSPERILSFNDRLYFFNSKIKKVFYLNKDKEPKNINVNYNLNESTLIDNSIVFFSKPDKLTILKGYFPGYYSLSSYPSDFNFDFLSSFRNNIYFLNKITGRIIKYPYLGNNQWGSFQEWLSSDSYYQNNINAESFAIDRSIWVLNNNTIYEYYTGELKNEINLDLFPTIKSFSKIYTSPELSNIYILEPKQKRIIIIDKAGEVIRQIRSDKFNNLLDLSVLSNEEVLYLLNKPKIYSIDL